MSLKAIDDASKILRLNAGAQILMSSVIGTLMLLPLQPWFPWKVPPKTFKEFGHAHLDWFMLGFMQHVAASIVAHHIDPAHPAAGEVATISKMLVFGGWMNPTAYVFRGLGIDAFVLGGSKRQFGAAILGAISSTAIILGWSKLFRLAYIADR